MYMPELHPYCTYCICSCLTCDLQTGIRDILLHVLLYLMIFEQIIIYQLWVAVTNMLSIGHRPTGNKVLINVGLKHTYHNIIFICESVDI